MCINLESIIFRGFIANNQEVDSLTTCSQDVLSTDRDEHEITEQVRVIVEEGESFTTQADEKENRGVKAGYLSLSFCI